MPRRYSQIINAQCYADGAAASHSTKKAHLFIIRKTRPAIAISLAFLSGTSVLADDVNTTQLKASDWLQYLPVVGAAAYSAYRHDGHGLWQLSEEVGATELLTIGLKAAFNNTSLGQRPDGGDHSFPSGHTSLACSGAAYIGERYGWEYSVPGYAVASYVAFIRVNEKRHHVRDVLAGCALATGLSLPIVNRFEGHDVSVTPLIGPNQIGLNVQMNW